MPFIESISIICFKLNLTVAVLPDIGLVTTTNKGVVKEDNKAVAPKTTERALYEVFIKNTSEPFIRVYSHTYFFQEELSATVRLKTRLSGVESLSTQ